MEGFDTGWLADFDRRHLETADIERRSPPRRFERPFHLPDPLPHDRGYEPAPLGRVDLVVEHDSSITCHHDQSPLATLGEFDGVIVILPEKHLVGRINGPSGDGR